MTKVTAAITISVDGYVAGPNDVAPRGLGDGGERLHYWVFGGPWTYEEPPSGDATGEDAEWLEGAMSDLGAIVGGRYTYEAAEHWGDKNPFGVPFFVVTHRPEDQPDDEFTFVPGVMGGADVIGQAFAARLVDELTIIIAPVVLGGGKRLFEGFSKDVELEHRGVRQSPFATFVEYRVKR
jgi:dihydrofolate reductase